jgi:NtrC-family two-component system sensor histidine kinase KinB
MTLRQRIVFTLVPLLLLMFVLGGAALFILHRLGGLIDLILRENYVSVIAMERLNDAVADIDSSFQLALTGREAEATGLYQKSWPLYRDALKLEQDNITLPGEGDLVERLTALSERYRREGDIYYARPSKDASRQQDYFVSGGLRETSAHIKDVASRIMRLNQDNMEEASREARRTARRSLIGFGIGLALTALIGAWLAWRTVQAILLPIRSVKESALAIGRGNLDQVVPVTSGDELGQLADAFNTMARQLRHYRQTDFARLLRAQRTSQATIDAFPDAVLVVDSQGQVEMANPAAQRILGVVTKERNQVSVPWQAPEVLRQPIQEALQEQRPYLTEEFDRAIVLNVHGERHFFLSSVFPINDPYGNNLGAAVLLQDITRFRLLDQVKSDLVATVSHELKTPLTSLRLALHLVLEEAVGPLTPKQTELLVDARDNAELLLSRVNSLLDLSRLEEGAEFLDLQPEAVKALLERAADSVRPRAEDKGIALIVEAPADLPLVLADNERLGYALGNLLDNALTYTDPGGRITLRGHGKDDTVTLSIEDTGIGIPAEHLSRVFTRFFRVPGRSQEGGSGLGLAIVREVVAAHRGSITCESHVGGGTIFRIELKAYRPAPRGETAIPRIGAIT